MSQEHGFSNGHPVYVKTGGVKGSTRVSGTSVLPAGAISLVGESWPPSLTKGNVPLPYCSHSRNTLLSNNKEHRRTSLMQLATTFNREQLRDVDICGRSQPAAFQSRTSSTKTIPKQRIRAQSGPQRKLNQRQQRKHSASPCHQLRTAAAHPT